MLTPSSHYALEHGRRLCSDLGCPAEWVDSVQVPFWLSQELDCALIAPAPRAPQALPLASACLLMQVAWEAGHACLLDSAPARKLLSDERWQPAPKRRQVGVLRWVAVLGVLKFVSGDSSIEKLPVCAAFVP